VQFKLEVLEDKIEFFEANDLKTLEKQINEKIEQNKAIMLEVHHVSHQMSIDYEHGRKYYSAVVHFKLKRH
jgi:hypothetical protein